ncbi:MAG: type II secretion system F family protein [Acidimicrobiales bacterium]
MIQRGLQPLELKEKSSILNFEITQKKVPRAEVMNFTRQLAVFMKAGVSIMEALEVIVEETQNKMLRKVIFDLIDSLRSGDTFATACAGHPEAFPNFYVGILESAELTGNLDQVLNQLAEYIERDQAARTKVTSALIYPKWWYAEVGLIVLVVGGFIAMRRSEKGPALLDAAILKLPVIGDITQTAVLERVCRILSSMLRAGVDLPRSMAVTADSANNVIFHNALDEVRDAMMQGQGLAGPIARTGLFPGAARQMFRVGEETGTLDQQLTVAADYYNRELETKLERATALFEPAIIVFMGVIVGFVAVALISAMYGIYNQVKVG